MEEARTALEAVLAIDSDDAGAYQLLAPIYASFGLKNEADRASALYLQWRDDPNATPVAARFFSAHPEWDDERTVGHVHNNGSAERPILTGALATPDH